MKTQSQTFTRRPLIDSMAIVTALTVGGTALVASSGAMALEPTNGTNILSNPISDGGVRHTSLVAPPKTAVAVIATARRLGTPSTAT